MLLQMLGAGLLSASAPPRNDPPWPRATSARSRCGGRGYLCADVGICFKKISVRHHIVTYAIRERVAKDPRDFGGDMDKVRKHLHTEASGGFGAGFISSLLNGISRSAFGNGNDGDGEQSSGIASFVGRIYRKIAFSPRSVANVGKRVIDSGGTCASKVNPPLEMDTLLNFEPDVDMYW
jgi:hypothetical protein